MFDLQAMQSLSLKLLIQTIILNLEQSMVEFSAKMRNSSSSRNDYLIFRTFLITYLI